MAKISTICLLSMLIWTIFPSRSRPIVPRRGSDLLKSATPRARPFIDRCAECLSRRASLFCGLPSQILLELNSIRQSALYPQGVLLFVEGEPARGLFVICTGQAKLSASSEGGKRITLRVVEPGEALGLSSVIANRPFQLSAETLLPSQVCYFPRSQFLGFMHAHPEVTVRVAEHLSMELHEAWQHTRLLSLAPCCRAKLAQFLLLRARQNGKPIPQGFRLPLNMTEEEIGEAIGATRETVSRLLTDFRRRHLIRVNGGSVVLAKPEELRAIATT